MDPKDGAVVALVRRLRISSRVSSTARRRPGASRGRDSSPSCIRRAFDKGYTPAHGRPGQHWAHSRNLVSVRIVRDIGVDYVRNYVTRFGFDKSQVPDDLTMALGTASLSPLQMATGYATFANGGFKVTPYYIDRIEDAGGKTLVQAEPAIACPECGRVTDPLPAHRGEVSVEPRQLQRESEWCQPCGQSGYHRCRNRRRERQRDLPRRRPPRRQDGDPGKESGAASHPAAGGLPARRYDAGRHPARHRRCRTRSEPRRYRRQDRHHQRSARRLVQRFQWRSGDDSLDRIRSGSQPRRR